MNWVNSLQYNFEGKTRRGYNKPYITEVKLYDVRIKKECAPEFIRDLEPITEHGFMGSWVNRILKLVRKVSGMGAPVSAPGKSQKPMRGWFYTYVIGSVDDWHNAPGEEAL